MLTPTSTPRPSPPTRTPRTGTRTEARRAARPRDHAARRGRARRQSRDPAGPMAPGVSRPRDRQWLAGWAIRPHPDGRLLGDGVAARSRSIRPTPDGHRDHPLPRHRPRDGVVTRLRHGDPIDLLGPLGRPFEVDPRSRHLLLIAGGLGMAGVRMLADEAIRDGRQVTLLFGATSAREVYPSNPAGRGRAWSLPMTARSRIVAGS